jgi:hypothetical protein
LGEGVEKRIGQEKDRAGERSSRRKIEQEKD